jgi:branched-chain amino acid transport system permease protein
MARLLGVRANGVMAAAFALSGLLAGVSALLLTARTGTLTPNLGVQPVLIAFVAAVLGGLGRLSGAVAGGMFLGAMTVFLQAVLPAGTAVYESAILYAAVILMLLFRPDGLLPAVQTGERI